MFFKFINESYEDVNNEASNVTTPLKEEFFNSPFYLNYLYHDKFHHTDKGCKCEMRKSSSEECNLHITKYCLTHDKTCSKTGWELGWYLGTNSRVLFDDTINCKRCGKTVLKMTRVHKYCHECSLVVHREIAKQKWRDNKKLRPKYKPCGM